MKIRNLLGNLVILGSLLLGLWLTIVVLFVGGIVQIINGIDPVNAGAIAWGIVKILFCEIGMIPTFLGWFFGLMIKEW